MKMEFVKQALDEWGEIIIQTSSGQSFELHTGDTTFDTDQRVIQFTASNAKFFIDGDSVEILKMHFSHAGE
ncbi:hypothetical protein [Numidum massiliense]|uniref:hypothetical protein n=1 Tax=Numidum massiliense TaxID=1522315 RepID=UPI0006D52FA7|nr:hypothetical protein [Numidum massiliense]